MTKSNIFTDPLVLAVVFSDYEDVKNLLKNGNYNHEVFQNIDEIGYLGIPIPLQYISRCWEICLKPYENFREPFSQLAKEKS